MILTISVLYKILLVFLGNSKYIHHFLQSVCNQYLPLQLETTSHHVGLSSPDLSRYSCLIHHTDIEIPPRQCCNFCFHCPTYFKELERRIVYDMYHFCFALP